MFWLPLHKVFSGPECLLGQELEVSFITEHTNEKLRRVHLHFEGQAGWSVPKIDGPPFIFHDGIAELGDVATYAPGTVVPVAHESLVERATMGGQSLGFRVPATPAHGLGPSLFIPARPGGARSAPVPPSPIAPPTPATARRIS